jgi:hypothetical protein
VQILDNHDHDMLGFIPENAAKNRNNPGQGKKA